MFNLQLLPVKWCGHRTNRLSIENGLSRLYPGGYILVLVRDLSFYPEGEVGDGYFKGALVHGNSPRKRRVNFGARIEQE